MHTLERIALWSILILIIFFLFFKNSSGFTADQNNFMSMNEFKWLPQPIKDSYASNVTKIIDALKPKLQTYMNSLPAGNQQQMLNKLNSQVDAYVAQIKSMTNDQIKSLAEMAASPSTGVIQNDMIPVRMAASPSSLVGINMSSPGNPYSGISQVAPVINRDIGFIQNSNNNQGAQSTDDAKYASAAAALGISIAKYKAMMNYK
jgi:hypothetical protein